jgi:hypothetical protein
LKEHQAVLAIHDNPGGTRIVFFDLFIWTKSGEIIKIDERHSLGKSEESAEIHLLLKKTRGE